MAINIYLIYLGLVLFSLSMNKHYKEIFNKNLKKRFEYLFKIFGTLILFLSFVLLIKNLGLSLGITFWLGVLTPLIIFIALILTYKSKLFIKLSIFLFFISLFVNLL